MCVKTSNFRFIFVFSLSFRNQWKWHPYKAIKKNVVRSSGYKEKTQPSANFTQVDIFRRLGETTHIHEKKLFYFWPLKHTHKKKIITVHATLKIGVFWCVFFSFHLFQEKKNKHQFPVNYITLIYRLQRERQRKRKLNAHIHRNSMQHI